MLPDTLSHVLHDADALLVVPPFASLDRPSIGAHTLQACARAAGFEVAILYANLLVAREIGVWGHQVIAYPTVSNLPGERFFAEAAYGGSSGVVDPVSGFADTQALLMQSGMTGDWAPLASFARNVAGWVDALGGALSEFAFPVIGCTTMFQQTAASIALLRNLKRRRPDVLAIIGGSNCEGQMAEGIQQLCPELDYVFSGECEAVFPAFLAAVARGERPASSIIYGHPCTDLDAIPTSDFSAYYDQMAAFLPARGWTAPNTTSLPYETSRGCWWGQKHHCTFCGLNGEGMAFRQKSPDRVLAELRTLTEAYPTRKISMSDNIMPYRYFKTLLPRLAQELPGLHIFYEQKANLSLERLLQLKAAGIMEIQPGIEALSTPLLSLMRKGVSAGQNIALLRFARAAGISVVWNLLSDFPGDRAAWYEATIDLLPLLSHLDPPTAIFRLSIDRFSPYFDHPETHGLRQVRPSRAYQEVLPASVDRSKVAYHFAADYESAVRRNPSLLATLKRQVNAWRAQGQSADTARPVLSVTPLTADQYLLTDTRGVASAALFEIIDGAQAALALVGPTPSTDPALQAWALDRKICVALDGTLVPLATASVSVLRRFQQAPDGRHQPRRVRRVDASGVEVPS